MALKAKLCLIPVFFAFVGCGTTPTTSLPDKRESGSQISGPASSANVESLLMRAGRSDAVQASQLRLDAARISVDRGEFDQARRILELVTNPFVNTDTTRDYQIIRARISLFDRQPAKALAFLNDQRLQNIPLTQDLQISVGTLRSEAYQLGRSYIASARERIYFDTLLDPAEKIANHEKIFSVLLELPAASLVSHAENAITSDLRGWLSLAAMTRQYENDPLRQLQELNNWKKVWSHHPAATHLPQSLQMLSRVVKEQPSSIAVLLPLQGELGPFGRAVRDGILASHYNQQESLRNSQQIVRLSSPATDRQRNTTIRIYDTTHGLVKDIYARAVAEGAELIIGPLDRTNVDILTTMNLPVPVIALNRSSNGQGNTDLYQFGLAPEDEVIQVAAQVNREGLKKGITIVPEGEWGDRNLATFITQWESMGGVLVDGVRFSNQRDYSDVVTKILNVDKSQNRSNELRRIIGQRFEFTPRRRQDIDFILLLANPAQARGINPTLAFFYADDIPVYATSHVHEYSESRIDAIDLNGIRFCDIPWKLTNTDRLQKLIQALWEPARSGFAPFYALGIDAYRLYPRLQQLKEIPGERLYGATGVLTLENNTVLRNLMWAQFKNGDVIPSPLVFGN